MRFFVSIVIMCLSLSAVAETFNLQHETNFEISVGGPGGGAAEELVGYMDKGGLAKRVSPSATSYGSPFDPKVAVWGWSRVQPSPSFVFFFKYLNGEEAQLNLNGTLVGSLAANGVTTSVASIVVADAASAQLYDLMGKAGVHETPGDISKTRAGRFVVCSGFHGYPSGPLRPSCTIQVQPSNARVRDLDALRASLVTKLGPLANSVRYAICDGRNGNGLGLPFADGAQPVNCLAIWTNTPAQVATALGKLDTTTSYSDHGIWVRIQLDASGGGRSP